MCRLDKKKDHKFLLERFVVGPMAVNSYLLADPAAKEACLIDAGADDRRIKKIIEKNGLSLKFIINTHGHGDHIAANGNFKAPIYIHKLDKDFLTDPVKNMSKMFFFNITSPKADRLIEEGDKIPLGNLTLEVIHTPGHTPGSVSIKVDGVVFTGDALFRGSIGRTDFPYGNLDLLIKSIKEKLLILPDDTEVYPGHGEPSTIGLEKLENPFLI